jgi:hypothetical protein
MTEEARPLRNRYVEAGTRCAWDGRLFFPARTISGATTEHYCSAECAWNAYQARPDHAWSDHGGES